MASTLARGLWAFLPLILSGCATSDHRPRDASADDLRLSIEFDPPWPPGSTPTFNNWTVITIVAVLTNVHDSSVRIYPRHATFYEVRLTTPSSVSVRGTYSYPIDMELAPSVVLGAHDWIRTTLPFSEYGFWDGSSEFTQPPEGTYTLYTTEVNYNLYSPTGHFKLAR